MRRNKKLAEEILEIILAGDDGGDGLVRCKIHRVFEERYPNHEPGRYDHVEYHLRLLESGGFVKLTEDYSDSDHDSFEMTWAGHDFLEIGLAN